MKPYPCLPPALTTRGLVEGGAESAEATGNQSNDLQTINSHFPIGISFLKQRSTMLGHQGFGGSVWEVG